MLTLTVPQTARLIGASDSWTYAAVERGEIRARVIRGRKFVLARPLLEQFGLTDKESAA